MTILKEDIDKFGLKTSDLNYLYRLFRETAEIDKTIIFGSRGAGNHTKGSDIDLALVGTNLTPKITSHIHYVLEEESPLPYFFDVVDYTHLTKKSLKDQIDRYGIVIFERRS